MEQFQQKPKDKAVETIECYIIKNKLKSHDKLPSERDFCVQYGFNRMTLRSALQQLIVDGVIYNRPGVGVFVAEEKISRSLSGLNSMTEYAKKEGFELSSVVLSFDESISTKELSSRLKIEIGSKIYILTRLRKMNKIPLLIETVYLSADRFPGLETYEFNEISLYKVLEDHFGVHVNCGEETIRITYLSDFEANLLDQPEGTPAFFIRSTTWDDDGNTVEDLKSVTRADIFCYTNVLNYSPKQIGSSSDA